MGTSRHWILLLQLISSVFAHGYDNSEFDGWYQPVPHRPVDIITDVVNDLGVRILQQYTAHGNVAFSPTGVGFVLAALYEGSAGRGSQQISDALALPRDRDITRIGFRDIHRRLRTYLNADGFLGGLTLNQENTRLRPEYEDVLKFYGFDLSVIEEETNATTPMPDTTTLNPVTEQPTTEAETTLATDETTPPVTPTKLINAQDSTSETEIPTTPPTTTTSPVELLETTLYTANQQDRLTQTTTAGSTTILMDLITRATTLPSASPQSTERATTPTTELPSTVSQSPSTTRTTSEMPGATRTPDVTPGPPRTVEQTTQTTTIANSESTTNAITTPQIADSKDNTLSGTPGTTTVPTTSSIAVPNTESNVTPNMEALTTSITEESTTSTTSMGPQSSDFATTLASATDSAVTELAAASTTISTASSMEVTRMAAETTTIVSASVSMGPASINVAQAGSTIAGTTEVSGPTDATTNGPPADESTVSTDPPANETVSMTSTSEIGSTDLPGTTAMGAEVTTVADEQSSTLPSTAKDDAMNRVRRRRSLRGFFSSYPDEGLWMQDLGIWKPYSPLVSEASVRDSTEIPFLVNGCDVSSVSAARYIAVLPFAYFPSLHAVALEFPLDDPRYNILLLMSTDRRDTYRLTRDLGGKSLRLLRNQLQPTWVRATIPSFMLRGFVTLTSFLQRLGILDVFEPRAADLSHMTPDLGVYARDVQQSIGVNIRNYMQPDRTHSRNGLFERAGPVPFTAVHPFLFFIVDAETSVALIAGRINDPLNSRIL